MFNINIIHEEGLRYYELFSLAGMIIGIVGSAFAAARKKTPFHVFALVMASGILGMILGSKLFLMTITDWASLTGTGHLPFIVGKSVVGAMLGGLLGAWSAGKVLGYGNAVLNWFAISGPLGMAVQRVGCLLAGCCHGQVTKMPWAISYGPGSEPYFEQQQLGLIPAHAMSSLPVHPDQLYNSLACLLISLIVWKTGKRWKSSSGQFLFSVVLFLLVRFFEDFLRFSSVPVLGIGLSLMQWKVLVVILVVSVILFFREKWLGLSTNEFDGNAKASRGWMKPGILLFFIVFMAFRFGTWMSGDEQRIIVYVLIPLSIMAMISLSIRMLQSGKTRLSFGLMFLGLVLMSQKADVPNDKPASYTSFNFSTTLGRFDNQHGFNYVPTTTQTDCGPSTTWTSDNYIYQHVYKYLGLGIDRKVYYKDNHSMTASFNAYAGSEKETAMASTGNSFLPNEFRNTLFGFNPDIQFDYKPIGFGVGFSLGHLGFGERNTNDYVDYKPERFIRKNGVNWRIRLFNEQKFFVELDKGSNPGTLGENNKIQFLIGSRFQSRDFLLKTGYAKSYFNSGSLVLQGEMPLYKRLHFSTGLQFNLNNHNSGSFYAPIPETKYRANFSLEYRFYDQLKKHKK